MYLRLIGAEGRMKPFECVGTFNEAKAAFHLTLLRYHEKNEKNENENEKFEINEKNNMKKKIKNDFVLFNSTQLPVVLLNMVKFVNFQAGFNESIYDTDANNDGNNNNDYDNDNYDAISIPNLNATDVMILWGLR
jgi:hypothetical protein